MVTTSCYNTFTSYTSPLLFLYSATLPLLRYHFFFALRLRACALQRCPSTLLFNAALQRCPSTLPFNAALQRCSSTLPFNAALQRCPSTLPFVAASKNSINALISAPYLCDSSLLRFDVRLVFSISRFVRVPHLYLRYPPPLTLSQISATSHVVPNLRHLSHCPKSPPPLTLS